MALQRPLFSPLLFLCFHLLAALHTTSDAALSSHLPQAMDCSTSGNYTSNSAYPANLNQFLASLPEKTIFKNGGFINDTVGEGSGTVYRLAMCSADYSRSDCGDCLAAAARSNANGLPNRCPGSTTVLAWFDPCLVRYSDTNFFGKAEIGEIYALNGPRAIWEPMRYRDDVVRNLNESIGAAVASSQRFAASSTDPYTLVQCTWDLPPDQCKQCLDVLTANASKDWTSMAVDGKRRSYSCSVRYGNTSFVVVPFGGAPTSQSVDQASRPATQSSGPSKGSWTAGVVGSVVGLILLACLAALVVKLKSKHETGHVREFTYRELATATLTFKDTRKLGQGAFGIVYKGAVMIEGTQVEVAIKKNTSDVSDETRKAFKNEVEIMSPLNHRNIIHLVGWCNEKNNLLLVYELVENRNLEARLYNHGGTDLVLDWRQRYNILVGIASGLEYLHNNCSRTVLHRDIKPANVMLDMDFTAKLCDFGLVTQLTRAATSRSTNNIIGTLGYMDPLYQQNGQVTKESDVYSFGVLLLEVLCGVAPILIGNPLKNSLIENVRECRGRNAILDAAHQRLRGEYDEEIKGALLIGLHCVETRRGDRPTIRIVLSNLVSLTASHVVMS
ncbi:unnamed protein product [Triticum aestivum]|uniref:Cysteine-rich receptor-like protein kinase 25 n=2 Tax=Triticum aestivum TaxID=4565 RepID=A0A9R1F0N8_WHEAT|nr:putative cysteine-rich receptor-like protein kinase 12 [Triticum aestivum]KAF7019836.1 hypothetical protein CFC21_032968 [Triticum aestivum]SPT21058.1 unnamed protein product [Triticum aestivum]